MFKRVSVLGLVVLLAGSAQVLAAEPGLVAWYRLNEGAGGLAFDSSGNGYDATILGTPTWTTRPDGGDTALTFGAGKTEGIECPPFDPTEGTGQFTVALWALWDGQETYHHFFTKSDRWGPDTMMFQLELWGGSTSQSHTNRIGISYDPDSVPFQIMPVEQWTHLAFVYDGAEMVVYMNGVDDIGPKPVAIGPATEARTAIGVADNNERLWTGILDDIQIYSRALEATEVTTVMEGDKTSASVPRPRDGVENVPVDIRLGWKPGESAVKHDVYFGAVFEDVNDATRSDPRDVLVSQAQTGSAYQPGSLEYGRTYYWRIDEVGETSGNTVFRGMVWEFTTEPLALPVDSLTVTASHSQVGAEPQNTIDGSGLNDSDQHGTDATTMWLAAPTPGESLWIQYEFEKTRKLHEMWIWNHNTAQEPTLGLGIENVTVEHSLDGQAWTSLGTVTLAQASGLDDYIANTSIAFDDVTTRYVRLTVQSGWGDTGQHGLSEVRFLAIPTDARAPNPGDGAEDVGVAGALSWIAGRRADRHSVYLSRDRQAVADGSALMAVVDQNDYTSQGLDFGSTYYWKIDEKDDDGSIWEGDIWTFTTEEYTVIEDFERYTDNKNAGEAIWQTWTDGIDDPPNCGGAVVGYEISPFAERTIVHGGQQSMPLTYKNSSFGYSQTYRLWDTAQDWTAGGAETLTLFLRGHPVDFVQRPDGRIIMGATGAGLDGTADQFRFAYKIISNSDSEITARIDSLIPIDDWSRAGVMIRESSGQSAKYAMVAVTPTNGVVFQYRWATRVETTVVQQVGLTAPYWVRLTRSGTTFTAWRSADGQTWVPITDDPADSTMEISMIGNNTFIGLALASNRAEIPTVAEFSNVATTGSGPWTIIAIPDEIEMPANDPEPLYVEIADNFGHSETFVHEDPNICQAVMWQPWSIPLSHFADAGVNLGAVKKMTVGLGDPINRTGSGAGIIYVDDIRIGTAVVKLKSEVRVENASFEEPGTQELLGFEDVPGWSTDWTPVDSGVEAGRDPTDGAWSAFLMAQDPAVWQLTEERIQPGDVFELTVDAGAACGNPGLLMTLYYDNEGLRIPAAVATAKLTGSMVQYSMLLDVADVPASIGHKIGIALASTDCWISLDNVHLYVYDRPASSQP